MATNGAVRWVVKAKLETLGELQDDGKVKVEVVLPWSKHKAPMYIPDEDLGNRKAGTEQVMLVEQGRPRKKQDGSPTEYDWDVLNYYWNFVAFSDQEPNWAPNHRPSGSSGSDYRPREEIFRSKEELRYTEAMHVAARLVGPVAHPDDITGDFLTLMGNIAKGVYAVIESNAALLTPAPAESANGQNQESAPARRPQTKPDNGAVHPGQIRKVQEYISAGVIVVEEITTVSKHLFGDHIQKPTSDLDFDQMEKLIEYLEQLAETKKLLNQSNE